MAGSRCNETDDSLSSLRNVIMTRVSTGGGGGEDYSGEGRIRNNNIQEHMISLGVDSSRESGTSTGAAVAGHLVDSRALSGPVARLSGPQSSLTDRPALLTAFHHSATSLLLIVVLYWSNVTVLSAHYCRVPPHRPAAHVAGPSVIHSVGCLILLFSIHDERQRHPSV